MGTFKSAADTTAVSGAWTDRESKYPPPYHLHARMTETHPPHAEARNARTHATAVPVLVLAGMAGGQTDPSEFRNTAPLPAHGPVCVARVYLGPQPAAGGGLALALARLRTAW